LRFATIAYRWQPLFGRTLQVSPFRRGKALTCIYTHERPDLCRELPNWMFDESYCVGIKLGPPEISIEGLNELAGVLAAFGTNRKQSAQSHPSNKKEKSGAEEPVSKSRAARSRAGTPNLSGPGGAKHHEGTGRSPGRSSAGGSGNRRGDIDEQGGTHHRLQVRSSSSAVSPSRDDGAQGVDIDRSTLAGWTGQGAALLDPIVARIREMVLSASKLHTDDTPVPMLDPG